MATWYLNSSTTPPRVGEAPAGSLVGGRVKNFRRTYTLTGTEAASDVIRLFKVKKGTRILSATPHGSFVRCTTTCATTATLHVGDTDGVSGDNDRYATSLNVASAGSRVAFDEAVDYVITTDDEWITATFATLTTPVEGGVLLFSIDYVEPEA